MPALHRTVGVVVAKRRLKGPWKDFDWVPVAILPAPPKVDPWTRLGQEGDDELFYLGPASLAFYKGDTAHYRDNLTADRPRVWVAIRETMGERPVELVMATVDPAEGEGLTTAGDATVETVPMPLDLAADLAAFFEENHVEVVFEKRKRKKADPEALATGRGPGGVGGGRP